MLKRNITYENIVTEETVTETFYFNLTRTEVIEMQVGPEGGMEAALQRMVKTKDLRGLMAEIKNIILMSYGVKSDDGKRFMKTDDIRQEFIDIGAFDSLFMELATDDVAASTFITGIVPKDFVEALKKAPDLPSPPLDILLPEPAKE